MWKKKNYIERLTKAHKHNTPTIISSRFYARLFPSLYISRHNFIFFLSSYTNPIVCSSG